MFPQCFLKDNKHRKRRRRENRSRSRRRSRSRSSSARRRRNISRDRSPNESRRHPGRHDAVNKFSARAKSRSSSPTVRDRISLSPVRKSKDQSPSRRHSPFPATYCARRSMDKSPEVKNPTEKSPREKSPKVKPPREKSPELKTARETSPRIKAMKKKGSRGNSPKEMVSSEKPSRRLSKSDSKPKMPDLPMESCSEDQLSQVREHFREDADCKRSKGGWSSDDLSRGRSDGGSFVSVTSPSRNEVEVGYPKETSPDVVYVSTTRGHQMKSSVQVVGKDAISLVPYEDDAVSISPRASADGSNLLSKKELASKNATKDEPLKLIKSKESKRKRSDDGETGKKVKVKKKSKDKKRKKKSLANNENLQSDELDDLLFTKTNKESKEEDLFKDSEVFSAKHNLPTAVVDLHRKKLRTVGSPAGKETFEKKKLSSVIVIPKDSSKPADTFSEVSDADVFGMEKLEHQNSAEDDTYTIPFLFSEEELGDSKKSGNAEKRVKGVKLKKNVASLKKYVEDEPYSPEEEADENKDIPYSPVEQPNESGDAPYSPGEELMETDDAPYSPVEEPNETNKAIEGGNSPYSPGLQLIESDFASYSPVEIKNALSPPAQEPITGVTGLDSPLGERIEYNDRPYSPAEHPVSDFGSPKKSSTMNLSDISTKDTIVDDTVGSVTAAEKVEDFLGGIEPPEKDFKIVDMDMSPGNDLGGHLENDEDIIEQLHKEFVRTQHDDVRPGMYVDNYAPNTSYVQHVPEYASFTTRVPSPLPTATRDPIVRAFGLDKDREKKLKSKRLKHSRKKNLKTLKDDKPIAKEKKDIEVRDYSYNGRGLPNEAS